MAYETYAATRHRLPASVGELSSRHELFIDTALELFNGLAAFAAADRSARLYDRPLNARRVEIDLEGGLFVAEHTPQQGWRELVTALASLAVDADTYDVVKHVFSGQRRTLLSSQFFRTASLDPDVLCSKDAIHDRINGYDIVGLALHDDQPFRPLSVVWPVVGTQWAYYGNLRPSERSVQFPTLQAVVGHRICETIDLMAGFAGRR